MFSLSSLHLGCVFYTVACCGCVGSVFPLVALKLMVKLKIVDILDSVKCDHLFHSTSSFSNRGRQVSKCITVQCGGGSRKIGLPWEWVLVGGGFMKGFLESLGFAWKGA